MVTSAITAIKGGVKKNKYSKFILNALQEMGQGGRCTVENGIAVIKTRVNECKGRSCVDGEERTDMQNCPDEVIA